MSLAHTALAPAAPPGGMGEGRAVKLHRPAVVLAVVAWLPLLVLAMVEHQAVGSARAFVRDVSAHVRFLFIVPFLWELRSRLDDRVSLVLDYLEEASLVETSVLAQVKATTAHVLGPPWRLRCYVFALFLGYAMSGGQLLEREWFHGASWQTVPGGATSLAGWWRSVVSIPLSNALFALCAMRFAVWVITLFRITPHLNLMPTHPDRYFGLYVVVRAAGDFWPLLFALSTTLAASLGTWGARGELELPSLLRTAGAFAIVAPLAVLTPLLILTLPIMHARRIALRDYSVAIAKVARTYLNNLERMRHEPEFRMDGDNYSWDTDMGTAFERVVDTRLLPIPPLAAGRLVIATVVPLLVLIFVQLPVEQALEVLSHLKQIFM